MKVNCYEKDDYTVYPHAIPEEGHHFIGWYDAEGKLVSTKKSFGVIAFMFDNGFDMQAGTKFVAKFE